MTSEDRIIKALRHQEIDRVPTFELLIDKKIINAILPGASYEEFIYAMDIDAVCVDIDYETTQIDDNLYKDEWGIVKKYTNEEHYVPISGPISTMKDLGKYEPPNINLEKRYKSLEKCIQKHKRKKAVILHLNDVFSLPSRLMPFEDFMISIAEEPKLIEGLIDMSVEVNLKMAKQAVKRGVKIIYTGDDYAYNSGPMVSPKTFKEMFYPSLKKIMQGYKDLGLLVIKHTDGNIMPIIDMIIDSGIDCLDPIDPVAGMDLAEIKERYGKKIALKGNVNCATTLAFGTVEETIEETKKCLRIGAPGGGYILSSSNSIHSSVIPDNYVAMLKTLQKYGTYPINIS